MASTRRQFLTESAAAAAALALHPGMRLNAADPPKSPFLQGNFAPVAEEQTLTDLKVVGELPRELDGLFVRNGPNPQFPPVGAYHWFEGDGMLHGVRIRDGQASYRNRFIRTEGYLAEKKAGKPIYPSMMEMPDLKKVAAGQNPFKTAANTNIIYHAGKCLALYEAGFPHEVSVPSLDTVGEYTYGGKLKHAMAAHPKHDPQTGELLAFGYVPTKPIALFSTIDPKGVLVRTSVVKLDHSAMIHDFAITKSYALFPVCPQTFEMARAFAGKSPWYFDAKRPTKFGLVPRSGTGETRWFEAKTCFIFHILNAYETETDVVLIACRYPGFPDGLDLGGEGATQQAAKLYQWRMNLKTGQTTEGPLDDLPTEFPRGNETRLGRQQRYGYCGYGAGDFFDGFVKFDLEKKTRTQHSFGAGRFGGEGVFVPRSGSTAEDDGWLMTYVYDKAENTSELVLVDARDLSAKPVARIRIPARVPYGFHGNWISGSALG